MDIERNVQQASQDVDTFMTTGKYYVDPDAVIQRVDAPRASWSDFVNYFGQWKNGKILLGTSYSWFALDIAFYGLGKRVLCPLNTIHQSRFPGIRSQLRYHSQCYWIWWYLYHRL
jgi:PHS family inorganic phosphate transporter-like MFS transporter